MSVSNFAPEMLELFRRAAQQEFDIKLETEKDAHTLRFRLHNLRKAMRKENHYLLHAAEAVTLSIKPQEDGTALLIATPADSKFLDALRNAGVEVSDDEDFADAEDEAVIEDDGEIPAGEREVSASEALKGFFNTKE